MSIILKEEAANSIPTPSSGKTTLFVDDNGVMSIKNDVGNISSFPTIATSNTQVLFTDGTAIGGDNDFVWDKNNNVLTVLGNIAATNIKTDNLLYANGIPWDLQQPGGSNTQIQFNDADQFGGSAALTFNKSSNLVSMGGALSVTGNANVGNLGTGGLITATGNVTGGNLSTAGTLSVTGNGNLGNVGATNGVFTANVSAGNISTTGVLSVTGNANVGNIGGTNGVFTANVDAANVNATGTLSVTGNANVGNLGTGGLIVATGNVTGGNLTTAGALSVTGNANVGNLGTAGKVVASTFESNVGTGTAPLAVSSTTLVANLNADLLDGYNTNTSASANTVVVRNADGNITGNYFIGNGSQLTGIDASAIQNGTANVRTFLNGNVAISASGAANVVLVESTGATVTGTLSVTGNANVGNLGTGGLITATGNVTGGNLTTAGALSVTGNANVGNLGTAQVLATANVTAPQLISNVSTGTAPLVVTSTTVVSNLRAATSNVANTVNDAAQPNITSLGTLTSLSVTGNVVAGNVYSNSGTIGALLLTGTLTTAIQPNITSLGTLSSLAVTGNVSAANFVGVLANGNSTVSIPVADGNINLSAAGGATELVLTSTGANITGTLNATGNANVNNLGTAQVLATSNVTAPQLVSNVSTGTAPLVVASTTKVSNLNADLLDGYNSDTAATADTVVVRDANANITGNNISGTLSTASQPNITSLGTLTGLGVNGTITGVNITANTGVFTGNGSGLSALAGGNVTGQVANALVAGTVYTAAQPNITSVGTLTSVAVTGNATAGNVYSNSGTIGASLLTGTLTTAAQPNITSVGTLGSLAVTGNVSAGNLTTNGTLTVTGPGLSSIAGNLDMTANYIINLAEPVNASDAATKAYVDSVAEGLHTHDSCNAATDGTLATISGGTVTYNIGTAGVGATLTTTGSYTTIDGVTLQNGMRILVKNEANAAHNGIYDRTSSTVLTRSTDFNTPAEMAGGDFTFVTAGTLYDNTGWVMTDPVTTVGTTNCNWTQFSGSGTYTAGSGLTLTGTQFSVNVAQPTVTSLGTLTGLNVNGNIVAANITANTGVITGNGSGLSALNASNISTGTLAQARLANASLTVNGQSITLGSSGTITANTTQTLTLGSFLTGTSFNGGTAVTAAVDATSANTASKVVARDASGNFSAGTITATLSGAATTAGTVTTAAQPNITSVGTLTSLAVTGNVTAGNLLGPVANGNSNVNIPAAAGNVNISVNGTANVLVVTATGANIAGTLNATGNANVGNIGAASGVFTTVAGTLTTAAQPNITSVGTLTSLNVTGNVAAGNLNATTAVVASTLTSNVATGTAPLTVTSTTRVNNLNVAYSNVTDHINVTTQSSGNAYLLFGNALTGNIAETANATFVANTSNGALYATTFVGALSGAATSATTAGTVTTAAQPNITSVGTLTGLGVNGTITGVNITANTGVFTGNGSALTAINASNISTGTLAQARLANSSLTVNGTSISLGGSGTITASTTNSLTINNSGSGSASGATFNGGSAVTISYNTVGAPSTTGTNASGTWGISVTGSAGTAGTVTTAAQPNITSVGTLTGLTSSGAVTITNSTAATSRTTGALIITGGIGASANSFFTNLNVASNIAYVAPNGANTINSQMLNGGTLAWSGNAGQLFSITDSMSGNIFSVNDVSGIPMITVSDTGTINLAPSGGFVAFGVSTGISAAGSTQGTATALTRPINVVSTVSAGQGVVMPTTTAGMRIIVMNTSATALNVYPATGGAINSGATNAAYSLAAGGRLEFIATSTTQWYTLNATFA